MAERYIRMDGDRWKVRLSRTPPHPEVQAVVFFPVTSNQRPYRVAEVPEDRVPDPEALDSLSERELEELFRDASSMGYPHSYA